MARGRAYVNLDGFGIECGAAQRPPLVVVGAALLIIRHRRRPEAIKQDRYFAYSETPLYIGKAVVALACDRKVMRKTGQALMSGKLAREYGFTDVDGSQPMWCY